MEKGKGENIISERGEGGGVRACQYGLEHGSKAIWTCRTNTFQNGASPST